MTESSVVTSGGQALHESGTAVSPNHRRSRRFAGLRIVRRHQPVNPDARGKLCRGDGWIAFDDSAAPYTPSQLKRERELNRTGASV
jgi:hypothetical protein